MLIVIDYYAENPIVGKTLQSCYLEDSNVYDDINGNGDSGWKIANSSGINIISTGLWFESTVGNVVVTANDTVQVYSTNGKIQLSSQDDTTIGSAKDVSLFATRDLIATSTRNTDLTVNKSLSVIAKDTTELRFEKNVGINTNHFGNLPIDTNIKFGDYPIGTNKTVTVQFQGADYVKIPGGSSGNVLTTDGAGNLSWGSGGGGGSSTQIITDITTQTVDTTSPTTVVYLTDKYNIVNENFIPSTGLTNGFVKEINIQPVEGLNPKQILGTTVGGSFQNVNDYLSDGTKIYVAPRLFSTGNFATYDSNNPNATPTAILDTNRLLVLDTTTNTISSIGSFNSSIFKIKKASNGDIWVCGQFTTINSVTFPGIAVWNGTTWINPCLNSVTQPVGTVFDFVIMNATTYNFYAIGTMTTTIGGTALNQTMYSINQGATITRAWGTTGFGTTPAETCCMAYDSTNNRMYVGHNATTFNGQAVPYIYQVDLTTGIISAVGTSINSTVIALTFYNNELIILWQGQFTTPFFSARICKYDGTNLGYFSNGFASSSVNRAWFKIINGNLHLFQDGFSTPNSTISGLGTMAGGMWFTYDDANLVWISLNNSSGGKVVDENYTLGLRYYNFDNNRVFFWQGGVFQIFTTIDKFRFGTFAPYLRYIAFQSLSGYIKMVWNATSNVWQISTIAFQSTANSTARLPNPVIL